MGKKGEANGEALLGRFCAMGKSMRAFFRLHIHEDFYCAAECAAPYYICTRLYLQVSGARREGSARGWRTVQGRMCGLRTPESAARRKIYVGGGKIYSFWRDGRFEAAVAGRIVRFGRIVRCGALRHTERMDFRTCWLQFDTEMRGLADLNKNSTPTGLPNLTQFPWYCWGKAVLLHVKLRDHQQEEKIRL